MIAASKRVLITGASGFVGSNLVHHERARDFDILAPNSSELDLLDYEGIREFLGHHRPEWVIHAAGMVGGIQANLAEPDQFITRNSLMGLNLLNACATDSSVKNIINLGSSCMYPVSAPNPLTTEYLFKGALEPTNEGYAMAKLLVAKLGQTLRKKNLGIEIITVIPCNLYGKYDHFEPPGSHLLAAIIQKIHEAKNIGLNTVEIWGSGTARREFLFAEDLANCLWMMVACGIRHVPDFVNIGVNQDFSVTELYKVAARVLGYEGAFVYALDKPVGIQQKLIDSKWINQWGWYPSVLIEEGVVRAYDYYLKSRR